MSAIVIGAPRRQWVVATAVAAGIAVASAAWVAVDRRSAAAWAATVIAGAAALLAGWQLYEARPRVVIDDRGVLDRAFAIGMIPWRDIEAVAVKRMHGQSHLCLTLRNAAAYTGRLSPMLQRVVALDRQLDCGDLSVNLDGSPVAPGQVLAYALAAVGG